MKLRLKYIAFILLVNNLNAQTFEQRINIVSHYDLNALNQLSAQYNTEFITNYNIAHDILTSQNLPISGVDAQNSYFSLKGIDVDSGHILFYKTTNNTTNNSSLQTSRVQNLYNGSLLGFNLRGQNMIVGLWEGSIPLVTHQNIGVERVDIRDGLQEEDPLLNVLNHSTHVAGTIMGNGTFQPFATGNASEATLWANNWDNDLAEMAMEASQGLLLSNHSYQINNRAYVNLPGYFGKYTALSKSVDELCYNAPFFQPVYAAGNDRNGIYFGGQLVLLNSIKEGYDLLTHQNVSKNAVVVGAVDGLTNYFSSNIYENNVIMSPFSAWGPTDDFRIKPDITTKGVNVYSSVGFSDSSYSILSGTSMAAPSVSAVFSLWQQYHNYLWPNSNNNSGFIRAASLKAFMAHTASECGNAEGPDAKFGWGLINAEDGVKIMKDVSDEKAVFKELILHNSETYEFYITADGTDVLKATIAWTDTFSESVTIAESQVPLLNNDLDLRIIKLQNNETIYPWKLNKSWNNLYALRGDNNVDPIEKVTYYNPNLLVAEAGSYKITISHKNTLQTPMRFSLIISGGIINYNYVVGKEEFSPEKLKIFPNPVVDILTFSNNSFDNIEIYDITGKKIRFKSNNTGDFIQIDMSTLSTGIYLLKLTKHTHSETFKIIKK